MLDLLYFPSIAPYPYYISISLHQQLSAAQLERERANAQATADNNARIAASNKRAEDAQANAKTLKRVNFLNDRDQGKELGNVSHISDL